MSKNTIEDRNDTLDMNDVVAGIEDLRVRLVDLEAMAHAAWQALEYIPYIQRASTTPAPEQQESGNNDTPDQSASNESPAVWANQGQEDRRPSDHVRVQLGRLQALVVATAETAYSILGDANQSLESYGSSNSDRHQSHGTGRSCERECSTLSLPWLGVKSVISITGPRHPVIERTPSTRERTSASSKSDAATPPSTLN